MIISGRTKYIPNAPTKNVGNESLTPAPLWTKKNIKKKSTV